MPAQHTISEDEIERRKEAARARCRAYYAANKAACVEKKRKYRAENPGKVAESKRIYYEGNKEAVLEWHKSHYRKDKTAKIERERLRYAAKAELIKQRTAAYYQANRDAICEKRRANSEAANVYNRNRRAAVATAEGKHTQKDIQDIARLQGHKCAYCRARLEKRKRHVDHIMPIKLGGSNDRTNLQLLCNTCNLKKSAKDPLVFARELGMLV